MITELKYAKTNTYLIKGKDKYILFDTDWAGTFSLFCKSLKKHGIKLQDIGYLFISHFHPDHMGIAQEIANSGVQIVVMDIQQDFIHSADIIFKKDKRSGFIPIDDSRIKTLNISDSRAFLGEIGITGEIFHTPGHSDDSISLYLDEGVLFVGDLNPLYELEAHKGPCKYCACPDAPADSSARRWHNRWGNGCHPGSRPSYSACGPHQG